MSQKFDFGRTVITNGACDFLTTDEVLLLLARHGQLDPGCLPKEDAEMNTHALESGEERIFSCYEVRGQKIYVITEWDRSVTTLLLPDEY